MSASSLQSLATVSHADLSVLGVVLVFSVTLALLIVVFGVSRIDQR